MSQGKSHRDSQSRLSLRHWIVPVALGAVVAIAPALYMQLTQEPTFKAHAALSHSLVQSANGMPSAASAKEHVALKWNNTLMSFQRILPDGTLLGCEGAPCFQIPAGKTLIITEMDWRTPTFLGPESTQNLDLVIQTPGKSNFDPPLSQRVFTTSLETVPHKTRQYNESVGNFSFTTGIAVRAPGLLVAVSNTDGIGELLLRGYFEAYHD